MGKDNEFDPFTHMNKPAGATRIDERDSFAAQLYELAIDATADHMRAVKNGDDAATIEALDTERRNVIDAYSARAMKIGLPADEIALHIGSLEALAQEQLNGDGLIAGDHALRSLRQRAEEELLDIKLGERAVIASLVRCYAALERATLDQDTKRADSLRASAEKEIPSLEEALKAAVRQRYSGENVDTAALAGELISKLKSDAVETTRATTRQSTADIPPPPAPDFVRRTSTPRGVEAIIDGTRPPSQGASRNTDK